MQVSWTIALGLAFAGSAPAADFDFLPYTSRAVASRPSAVAIGDVNGDGRNDVVVATAYANDTENDYSLFVYLQDTNGSLGLPYKVKYATLAFDVTVTLGDLNGDGRQDIIVGTMGGLNLLIANSAGGFASSWVSTE